MNMLLPLLSIIVFMACIWLVQQHCQNPSVIDVAWAPGIVLISLMHVEHANLTPRLLLLGTLLILWALRLSGFIWWTRIRHGLHDKRYTAVNANWGARQALGFFFNGQLQGLFILVISLPWYFIAKGHALTFLDELGIALTLCGLLGETCADVQLHQFKQRHPGKVCDDGLWFYSRHPNYFFEWLVWCGFACCALSTPWGSMALLSPLALYLIMTRITAPLTELGSIESRGNAYLRYQQNTRLFFPLKLK